jgi:hypothetical protein
MSRKQASSYRGRAPDPDLDDAPEDERAAAGPVPEIIRRMATLGLSGFFMTESAIRRAFGETVPKEWIDFANEQSERTRSEVIDRVIQEMSAQLADTDPVELMSKFLEGHTIEIEAKLRVSPRTDDETPGIRTRFKLDRD